MLTRTTNPIAPINLAHVASFRLGDVEVQPATRQIIRDGAQETLEPRVMQVLVALAQAGGAVVTRDELTDLCWDGRIVSENAINRVISRLRQVAAEFAGGSFQLETITKVGYRIVTAERNGAAAASPDAVPPPPATVAPPARFSRRAAVGGGLAASLILAGGGYWVWTEKRRHQPTPEAAELFRRGTLAQRDGVPEQVRQAVSFFEQAVAADPIYAEAWGALALSYRHILEGFAETEQASLPDRIRSAADRALALDPDNADARLALLIAEPYFRNWAEQEVGLRRLADSNPDHWLVRGQLGLVLQDVGRLDESIDHSRRVIAIDPFLPVGYAFLIRGLSCAGRIQEADAVLDAATRRWPSHPFIWNVGFNFLLFSGRPGSAAAYVSDPRTQPENMPPAAVASRVTLARAVEFRRPGDMEASIEAARQMALSAVAGVPLAAPVLALLDQPDLAFAALERYYFGTGPFADWSAPGRYDRRYTIPLFSPPMARFRGDPRYRSLLRRTGLEFYWEETGTQPDFRRVRET